jgi:class 3 adenylate cyclase
VDNITDTIDLVPSNRVSQLSDMALVSFLLLISSLKKSKKMVKYNTHKGLNIRMPNYKVRLGLGLHLGYGIEGAIGSYYKIDASYLSPNVRMSERLETLTKVYACPILLSGNLFQYLTEETQNECRQVDYCIMGGMDQPMALFTVDVSDDQILLEDELPLSSK